MSDTEISAPLRTIFAMGVPERLEGWLVALELAGSPWCSYTEETISWIDADFNDGGAYSQRAPRGERVRMLHSPAWVVASFQAAHTWVDRDEAGGSSSVSHVAWGHREHWRNFLVVASRLPELTGAVEAARMLGGANASTVYVREQYHQLVEKLGYTPFLDAIDVRQRRRTRRISGRPGFAGDMPRQPTASAFDAEARAPRLPKPKP